MAKKVDIKQLNKSGGLQRSALVHKVNEEDRTVELAFSSEIEVERWFGIEILDHDPRSVRLGRLGDGAALLVNHDWNDQVGVIEQVEISTDRRGRAVVRFGKSARAEEIFQDIKDNIRRHVSVGYHVHAMKHVETRNNDDEVFKVTDWEPFEISVVSVPADTSVGVGRSKELASDEQELQVVETAQNTEDESLISQENKGQDSQKRSPQIITGVTMEDENVQVTAPSADSIRKEEQARIRSIMTIGDKFNSSDMARNFVESGKTADEFRAAVLEKLDAKPVQERSSEIGLSDKETENYSFVKVIRALSDPTNARAQKDAAFEFEASRAAAQARGKDTENLVIPTDVLSRAVTVGAPGSGGALVDTKLATESFYEVLRNNAPLMGRSRLLTGLNGNVAIPGQNSGATGYWLAEGNDAMLSNSTFEQLGMTPKTVAAYSELSRKLVNQSSIDIEAFVRNDLAKALAGTIDVALLNGPGGEVAPLGILYTDGVAYVHFIGEQPTYSEIVALETAVAVANAESDGMYYICGAQGRGSLKTTEKFPGSSGQPVWETGNTVNGYETLMTNNMEGFSIGFGNMSNMIVGMWGGLELVVDPYSKSRSGNLIVTAFQDVDAVIRHPESFAVGIPLSLQVPAP